MVYHPAPVSEPSSAKDLPGRGRTAAVVGLLSLLAFAPAALGGFVYDDRWTVVRNTWLDAPLGSLLGAALSGTAHGLGIPDATRPAMIASLWLDRRLFGLSPVGYHLHSLFLYADACVAAFLAASSLLRSRLSAFVSAVFFAVAPLHAEVASAINYREDLIAAIGILIPLWWLFREGTAEDPPGAAALVSLAFAWGLLGKESAAALVVLVILCALVLRVDRAWLVSRERTLYFLGSVFVLWLNWRLSLTLTDDGIPRAMRQPLPGALLDTARFVARSVLAAAVPVMPSPEYSPMPHAGPAWALVLATLPLSIAALARRPRTRPLALALGLAAIAPLGASPLVGPVNPWADRYAFVGVLGGGLAVGTLLSALPTWPARRPGVAGVAALALAGCMMSWRAARVWRSERGLWTYAVTRAPDSARAWAALSRVERLDGNLDEADRLVARALALAPEDIPARVTRIYNLLARGLVGDARREIGYVDLLRGGGHPGMARARACAQLSPEAAPSCARIN